MSTRRIDRCLSLDDFEPLARRHLPHPLFEYIRGGSETNASLRSNLQSFQDWGFVPRVMNNVSGRSATATLMGRSYAAPIGIAPMGLSALMAYRGDIAMARAARSANLPMIMSGSSLIRLEDVAVENPDMWFQAYLPGEPERILALVDRVAAAGIGTLVITVDTATLANRENNVRAGFSTPLRPGPRLAMQGLTHPAWTIGTFLWTILRHGMPHFENSFAERGAPIMSRSVMRDFRKKDHLDWSHFALIRERWKGNLVIKGLVSPADAERAVLEGAQGIVVSNHGGRQLDGTIPPLRMLPAIRDAVDGRAALLLDGGVRRGSDVLKALALGADAVLVGRPMLYAVAVGGEAGIARALGIVMEEIHRNMALLGIRSLDELDETFVLRTVPQPE